MLITQYKPFRIFETFVLQKIAFESVSRIVFPSLVDLLSPPSPTQATLPQSTNPTSGVPSQLMSSTYLLNFAVVLFDCLLQIVSAIATGMCVSLLQAEIQCVLPVFRMGWRT